MVSQEEYACLAPYSSVSKGTHYQTFLCCKVKKEIRKQSPPEQKALPCYGAREEHGMTRPPRGLQEWGSHPSPLMKALPGCCGMVPWSSIHAARLQLNMIQLSREAVRSPRLRSPHCSKLLYMHECPFPDLCRSEKFRTVISIWDKNTDI